MLSYLFLPPPRAPLCSDTKANNFERAVKDQFQAKAVDIGELQHIIVRKDNAGLGADWHLQSVEIWHPGSACVWGSTYVVHACGGAPR